MFLHQRSKTHLRIEDNLFDSFYFFVGGFEQRKVDIANHAPTYAMANAEFCDNNDGSMTMIASRDIPSDEEVCVCYGEHNNEQLLFCYGFIIPDNPCQGLLCPLPFPDTPCRAELLHYTLADHRKENQRNPLAKAGPTLRRPSTEAASAELLLALKISDMSEEIYFVGNRWQCLGVNFCNSDWICVFLI